MLFYPAALPLSSSTLNRVARLIRAHRKTIGSRWRALDPGTQALLTLAYLRKGETLRDLAAGFGISAATAWRRTRETIGLLAAHAPGIRDALRHAKRSGAAFVILDGTLAHIDRNQIDRPFYSGKHKRHGMNLQAIADARGNLLWISGAIRGSSRDTAAVRKAEDPLTPRLSAELQPAPPRCGRGGRRRGRSTARSPMPFVRGVPVARCGAPRRALVQSDRSP